MGCFGIIILHVVVGPIVLMFGTLFAYVVGMICGRTKSKKKIKKNLAVYTCLCSIGNRWDKKGANKK
jgi:hypothetical protein